MVRKLTAPRFQLSDFPTFRTCVYLEPVLVNDLNPKTAGGFFSLSLCAGGWSTTLAAAVDPRIQLSFPTAGSVPFDLKVGPYKGADMGDYEQLIARPIYKVRCYSMIHSL